MKTQKMLIWNFDINKVSKNAQNISVFQSKSYENLKMKLKWKTVVQKTQKDFPFQACKRSNKWSRMRTKEIFNNTETIFTFSSWKRYKFYFEIRTKMVFQKTPKEVSSRAWTWPVIFHPITARKAFSKNAQTLNLLVVYTRAERSGRENVHKIQFLRVYTDIKSGNTKSVRVHAQNLELSEIFTTTFWATRLNAQNLTFWAFMRVFWDPCLPGKKLIWPLRLFFSQSERVIYGMKVRDLANILA
jgi:hypothetical protein